MKRSLIDAGPPHSRRGAVLVWAAGLLVLILSITAFAVDMGYMSLVATQLQNAADAAALSGVVELSNGNAAVLAEVQETAAENRAAGNNVAIASEDVEFGWYETSTRTFTEGAANTNAIRVTARVADQALFFAPILGRNNFDLARSAIAMLNPRDIAFVVDLSGSMNDDTEPCWATDQIGAKFTPLGYPTVSVELMQNVFDDFGYGAFPGASEYIFQPLGLTVDPEYAYAEATKDDGPLTQATIDPQYRILNDDDEETRERKAYSWLMDVQISALMPGVKPIPNSTDPDSYAYWEKYIDYLLHQYSVGISPPPEPDDDGEEDDGEDDWEDDGDDDGSDDDGSDDDGGSPPPPPPPSGRVVPLRSLRSPRYVQRVPRPRHGELADRRWLVLPTEQNVTRHSVHPFDLGFPSSTGRRPRLLGTIAGMGLLPSLRLPMTSAIWGDGPAGVGVPRNGSFEESHVPDDQDDDRIEDFNNPNLALFADADDDEVEYWRNTLGYITYVQFMMDWGRDRTPVEDNDENAARGAGPLTPLAADSPDCPLHSEATAGGTFDFPPREQPMHAVRRALIAVAQEIKTKNAGLSTGSSDRVSLVTYDGVDADHQPAIVVPLTNNFDSVMTASSRLQAVSDIGNTTATENGILLARQHLATTADGGQGRTYTTKVIVLCTDGVPNAWQSSASDINAAITANPSADYYPGGYVWYNSVLRQAADMQRKKDKLYPVGMGLGADLAFMDKVARLAETDEGGLSPRGTGNPADYEQQLINIFQKIINTRSGKLVK